MFKHCCCFFQAVVLSMFFLKGHRVQEMASMQIEHPFPNNPASCNLPFQKEHNISPKGGRFCSDEMGTRQSEKVASILGQKGFPLMSDKTGKPLQTEWPQTNPWRWLRNRAFCGGSAGGWVCVCVFSVREDRAAMH